MAILKTGDRPVPFGGELGLTGSPGRFTYNGNEFDDEYGFDLYYYGASPGVGFLRNPTYGASINFRRRWKYLEITIPNYGTLEKCGDIMIGISSSIRKFQTSVLLCALYSFIPFLNTLAAHYRIVDERMMGVTMDTAVVPAAETTVVNLIDSIQVAEISGSALEQFYGFPRIIGRYSLEKLPNVNLYQMMPGKEYVINSPLESYYWVLFNIRNNGIYYFGGDVSDFSKVIENDLDELLKNDLIALIEFYLNTLSTFDPYWVLRTPETFRDLCDLGHATESTIRKKSNLLIDIETVEKAVEEPKVNREANHFNISLYSWRHRDGAIQYWEFKISDRDFVLVDSSTVFQHVGLHGIR